MTDHSNHATGIVYANMITYEECDDCEVITQVWSADFDNHEPPLPPLWTEGDPHDLLIHYVGHDWLPLND